MRSVFILLLILLLSALISCVKEDMEKLPVDLIVDLPRKGVPGDDSNSEPGSPGEHVYQKVFTSYVAVISGSEVISGIWIRDDIPVQFNIKGVCWSKSANPTIIDNKIEDMQSATRSHYSIKGLELNTRYYLRAYIIDEGRIEYGGEAEFTTPATAELVVFNTDLTYNSVTDIEGNIYKTIQIGNQTWMAENLKTTKFNDGKEIPNIIDNTNWVNLKTGAYRWFENDEATFKNLYGAMYNWYAANTGKLCPAGWHVPDDSEWKQLEMTLGMTKEEADSWGGEEYGEIFRGTDQGNQMKTTSGWTEWGEILDKGNNISGFSALPGGDTGWYGWDNYAGGCTSWWTSTRSRFDPESTTGSAVARVLGSGEGKVGRGDFYKHIGFSVRCVKD